LFFILPLLINFSLLLGIGAGLYGNKYVDRRGKHRRSKLLQLTRAIVLGWINGGLLAAFVLSGGFVSVLARIVSVNFFMVTIETLKCYLLMLSEFFFSGTLL
jgi:hypothetical protein